MIPHGDEHGRRNDEGDAGHVGRILWFADEERMQVVHAVLRIMRLGRLGIIGIGLGRHGHADELLNLPILLDRRLDQVDPDRGRRDLQFRRFEQLAPDRCGADPSLTAAGFTMAWTIITSGLLWLLWDTQAKRPPGALADEYSPYFSDELRRHGKFAVMA